MAKKKPTYRHPEQPGRTKHKNAGPGGSRKTRPQVPSTPANKAASGKQTS